MILIRYKNISSVTLKSLMHMGKLSHDTDKRIFFFYFLTKFYIVNLKPSTIQSEYVKSKTYSHFSTWLTKQLFFLLSFYLFFKSNQSNTARTKGQQQRFLPDSVSLWKASSQLVHTCIGTTSIIRCNLLFKKPSSRCEFRELVLMTDSGFKTPLKSKSETVIPTL